MIMGPEGALYFFLKRPINEAPAGSGHKFSANVRLYVPPQNMGYESENSKYTVLNGFSPSLSTYSDIIGPQMATLIHQTSARINELAELPPDWDEEGAESMSDETRQLAYGILKSIVRQSNDRPNIYLNHDGSVLIAWQFGNSLVDAIIKADRTETTLHVSPEIGTHSREKVSMDQLANKFASLRPHLA